MKSLDQLAIERTLKLLCKDERLLSDHPEIVIKILSGEICYDRLLCHPGASEYSYGTTFSNRLYFSINRTETYVETEFRFLRYGCHSKFRFTEENLLNESSTL